MKIIWLSHLRGGLNMLSTCQHCWGPCKMEFCIIFVIFAFWGVHSSHFSHHFLFHFLDHFDYSSAKYMKMSQKWSQKFCFCVIFETSQGSPYNGLYMLEYLVKAPIALPSPRFMHLRQHALGNRSPWGPSCQNILDCRASFNLFILSICLTCHLWVLYDC